MPNKRVPKSRKVLGRDPFADLETLDFFDDELLEMESPPPTIEATSQAGAEVPPVAESPVVDEAMPDILPDTAETLEDSAAPAEVVRATAATQPPETTSESVAGLDYDSYIAQHPELFDYAPVDDMPEELPDIHDAAMATLEGAAAPEDVATNLSSQSPESLEPKSIDSDNNVPKPSKTEMLGAMGIDFDTLEAETENLDNQPKATVSKPSKTQLLGAMGIDFDTLEAETENLDNQPEPTVSKPSKTQLLGAMGIDFDTLEAETENHDNQPEPTVSKPSKTAMLGAMGIDFDTLEAETEGLGDLNNELPISTGLLDIDFDALDEDTDELEAAFAAQAEFEAAVWRGLDEVDGGLDDLHEEVAATEEPLAGTLLEAMDLESLTSAPSDAAQSLQSLLNETEDAMADLFVNTDTTPDIALDEQPDTGLLGADSLRDIDPDTRSPEPVANPDIDDEISEGRRENGVSMSLPNVVSAIDNEMHAALDELLKGIEATETPAAEQGAPQQFLLFELDQLHFAIPVTNVTEISQPLPVTKVPNLPSWVLGVSNLRGDIVSVLDLRLYFLGHPQVIRPDSRFLVVHDSQVSITTTLVVDHVVELQSLVQEQLAAKVPPELNTHIAPFVTGVYQMNEREIVILDLDGLLSSANFRQFEPL